MTNTAIRFLGRCWAEVWSNVWLLFPKNFLCYQQAKFYDADGKRLAAICAVDTKWKIHHVFWWNPESQRDVVLERCPRGCLPVWDVKSVWRSKKRV